MTARDTPAAIVASSAVSPCNGCEHPGHDRLCYWTRLRTPTRCPKGVLYRPAGALDTPEAITASQGPEPPTCPTCGNWQDWEHCDQCEDGYVDLYDEDPLFYDEGDVEPCHTCDGHGGWWVCRRCTGRHAE